MKSYFVAALSFVGVLGSAAAAMAINNDTLAHGGTDLTAASSKTLVSTTTVDESTVIDPATGLPLLNPGASGAPLDPHAAPTLPPALSLPAGVIGGTSGGSAAWAGAGSPSASKAHPISKPGSAPGASSGSAGSGAVSGTTGGSSAAAPPVAGGGTATDPGQNVSSRPKHERGEHEGRKHRDRPSVEPTEPAHSEDSEGDD